MDIETNDEKLLSEPLISPKNWLIKKDLTFLNNGSFGSCPIPVLNYQQSLKMKMEEELVDFLLRHLEQNLDTNRNCLAQFLGCHGEQIAFIQNATTGVNAILRSLKFEPNENIIMTSHVYNACANVMEYIADNYQVEIKICDLEFPFEDVDQWVEEIISKVDSKSRIVLIDHITSPTAVINPVQKISSQVKNINPTTLVLVDGAHSPGQIPVNLESLNIDFYTGNLHKWMFTPKTSAFLYVKNEEKRIQIHPTTISHGANSKRTDRSKFHLEFDWIGTYDPTPHLCTQFCIEWIRDQVDGGWEALMIRNNKLALLGRKILCETLGVESPCPQEFIPAMATIPLPDQIAGNSLTLPLMLPDLQEWLRSDRKIEVPVTSLRNGDKIFIRISAQAYNCLEDYVLLAEALKSRMT